MYYESQHDKCDQYGHCGRISVNNCLGRRAIGPRNESIIQVLSSLGEKHGSLMWGRWTKDTLVAVCQKEGLHIVSLTKWLPKFRSHTYYEIVKCQVPLVIYGETDPDCEWNHFVATRDGLIFDPDREEPVELTVKNLYKIFKNIYNVYSIV
jgi:hypothetical protein